MSDWLFKLKDKFIPGPVELGLSDHDALQMEAFDPFADGPTWEQYHKIIKEKYPVRNWIFNVFLAWFDQKFYNLRMRYYDFLSIYVNKDHLVDLRQKSGFDRYTGGYTDPVNKVLRANFRILCDFVESEEFERQRKWYLEEDQSEDNIHWKEATQEMINLHHYWMVERQQDEDKEQILHKLAKNKKTKEEYDEQMEEWLKFYRGLENKEDEMLTRLLKIRRFLWT